MTSNPSMDVAALQTALVTWLTGDTHLGLFASDVEFRIVMWNRWMEIHSGYSASDVVGRSIFEVYPDLETRGLRESYEAAVAGRVTVLSHGLHRFVLPLPPAGRDLGLSEMPQAGRISPILVGDTIVGTLTSIEDVSDRVGSEVELRRQIEAQQRARGIAERALRAKDEFLSTLSHEMRTPLNAVHGWARILLSRKEIDPELLERALRVIERNTATQTTMIDDMLDMSRIAAGKLQLQMEPVDVEGVILAAVDVVAPSANARRIHIRLNLEPDAPRLMGDPDRLQQIVWNLLSNAVKFSDPGTAIDVRLATSGPSVQVIVADAGHGISAEFLPHVFERFRQYDSSSSRRYGGLGLGLALVRDLVQLHGGSVRAESAGEGQGATFTVEFPAIDAPHVRATRADPQVLDEYTAASLSGIRVLLVEDESDARDIAITALESRGAQVTAVSSTLHALGVLRKSVPDSDPHVLVSDLGMPGEDGYELIRQVRAMKPSTIGRIPAVAVSGYATSDDVARALAAGYQLHIAKPMDPALLGAAIGHLVRKSD